MSFPVSINFATPPEGTCPQTFSDAVAMLQSLITGEVTTTYTPYVLGSATPAVEDQDKAWIRLDAVGRPLGTFLFYAGAWRREYRAAGGMISMFQGDPALAFDGTGLGLIGAGWDGWAICNGQNGTVNLSDKFIVAAHMDNSDGDAGYSSGWRAKLAGTIAGTGGAAETTLVADQIPRAATADLVVDLFSADGNSRDNAGLLFGHHSVSTGDPGDPGTEILIAADAGNASPDPVPTLPPYYALAYVVFLGYA